MLELLIIFVLNKFEKTGYGIRKEIIEKFGAFIEPSFGSLHPILKKMVSKKYLEEKKNITSGGKRNSYFYLTNEGIKYFSKLFVREFSLNPSCLKSEIYVRFAVYSLAKEEEQEIFLKYSKNAVLLILSQIKKQLENEYLKLDFYQKTMLKNILNEYEMLLKFLERFKNECNNK